jgi:hypothetical protein
MENKGMWVEREICIRVKERKQKRVGSERNRRTILEGVTEQGKEETRGKPMDKYKYKGLKNRTKYN